ncbi:hypothetical protein GALL_437740 [mine drainage metagenome]|uniref:Uncharacterized protein n=1 Tax=mine drainage metagenome TaxID=410659 RepID=A0A1J5QAP5_9ZZZZ
MFAAIGHAEFHNACHFLPEAHAAGALDATAHFFHGDQRARVLVEDNPLFFGIARGRSAVANGQILQLAFAALVADRAVERMVDEQKLHHAFLRLERPLGMGAHHHALCNRRGAGGQRLGSLFHIHQAHAAIGRDGQLFVIAKVRHIQPELGGRVHDHRAFWHLDFLTVDFEFNHDVVSCAESGQIAVQT